LRARRRAVETAGYAYEARLRGLIRAASAACVWGARALPSWGADDRRAAQNPPAPPSSNRDCRSPARMVYSRSKPQRGYADLAGWRSTKEDHMFRLIPVLLLLAFLTSCGQVAAPATQSGAPTAASSPGGDVTPVFAFSEAVVGQNRMAIGLLRGGTPLNDPGAKVHLRFFNLDEANTQVKFEADATYYGQGLPAGFYVAYPTIPTPGNWGIEVNTQLSGQTAASSSRLRLNVLATSAVPNVGDHAVPVKTLTVKDVPDPAQLSSGANPDPAMYQISLDQALTSGKPTALLFATPAFCKTATCGPSLQVMQGLQKTYGDKLNFIHSEVYKYPFSDSVQLQSQVIDRATKENRQPTLAEQQTGLSDAMVAWRLQSEPWLFLIDAQGTIVARFEGGITKEELDPALKKLIAGQKVVIGPTS
jgi:hypothetical protein